MSKGNHPDPSNAVADDVALVPFVPTPPAIDSPQALMQMMDTSDSRRYCSFDMRTPAGLLLLDKCEEAPDRKLSEMANLEFALTGFYLHYITLEGKGPGEVIEAVRSCLITDDGQVFAAVSEGVRKSIARLVAQHGLPPWKTPVPVKVVLKRLDNGHNWLTILNNPPPLKPKGAK